VAPENQNTSSILKAEYLQVVEFIAEKLKNLEVKWVITGSLNHAMHGIDISPNDIDILSDKHGVYLIEKEFQRYIIKKVAYSTSENLRSYYGMLCISGINIDIMAEIENRLITGIGEPHIDWEQHIEQIKIGKYLVPVLSLEYEHIIYKKLNKPDRIRKILERLGTK